MDVKRRRQEGTYSIHPQRIRDILYSVMAKLIVGQNEWDERLSLGVEADEEDKEIPTLFIRSASPRCCAPRSPISLSLRLSEASVFRRDEGKQRRQGSPYRIYAQRISEMSCFEISNLIAPQVKWGKDLCSGVEIGEEGKANCTVFVRNASPRCCAPRHPIRSRPRWSDVSVYIWTWIETMRRR